MKSLLILFLTISCVNLALSLSTPHFFQIYDPSVNERQKWYINDHTIVQDMKGVWHLFGITFTEPFNFWEEKNFAHATAPTITGPWTKQKFALSVDRRYHNETVLWAPHVIQHNGTYYMFYCGGGPDFKKWMINMATSKDMFKWTRSAGGPLFRDGLNARDPMVIQINGTWHIYYTANERPEGGHHIVAVRTSSDLLKWSERKIVFRDPTKSPSSSNTESPYVIHRNGKWYLFTGPRGGYIGTDVFVSDDPTQFTINKKVGHIFSHALEVVKDRDLWWVTHAGWGQGGVFLAPLYW